MALSGAACGAGSPSGWTAEDAIQAFSSDPAVFITDRDPIPVEGWNIAALHDGEILVATTFVYEEDGTSFETARVSRFDPADPSRLELVQDLGEGNSILGLESSDSGLYLFGSLASLVLLGDRDSGFGAVPGMSELQADGWDDSVGFVRFDDPSGTELLLRGQRAYAAAFQPLGDGWVTAERGYGDAVVEGTAATSSGPVAYGSIPGAGEEDVGALFLVGEATSDPTTINVLQPGPTFPEVNRIYFFAEVNDGLMIATGFDEDEGLDHIFVSEDGSSWRQADTTLGEAQYIYSVVFSDDVVRIFGSRDGQPAVFEFARQ